MADFTIESFQNEFLPLGAETMHAVITVTAAGTSAFASVGTSAERWELLMVDTSGSMSGKKLRSAKEATAAAVDCIPDGAQFGIITGNHEASVAFPEFPPLAVSSPKTRSDAKAAVKKFEARGGTAIGSWVELARYLLSDCNGIRHAILLTDGKNESEHPQDLERALERAEGVFQCDCRGVGDGWEVAELRKVANALLGSLDIIAQPEDMTDDFTGMMRESAGKNLAEVTLRVWTPKSAEVVAFKQLDPYLDLTPKRVETVPPAGDYPTGSWGDESRDFHLTVRVAPGEIDDRMLAARVTLIVGDEPVGEGQVLAQWTDDVAKSTRVNHRVAEALGDADIADEIELGLAALHAGDEEEATGRFARAHEKAVETGNEIAADNLSNIIEQDDVTGRFKLKGGVTDIEIMTLDTQSRRTSRKRRQEPPEEPS